MQEREKIRQLFERYQQGRCTPEEQARLHTWFNRYASREASGVDELLEMYEANRTYKQKQWLRWLPHAAVLAMALTTTWYFWGDSDSSQPTDNLVVQSGDIVPGGNRATLALADGRTIDLSEAQSGIVVGDEQILYAEGAEALVNLEGDEAIPLVMSTPRGGTYQITLSDGTKVWLNAASTLKYPSKFSRNKRLVEIDGEAYFSVVKDAKRPFRVVSKGQEIEVLGTAFNISAYQDEAEIKTTLIEGSVRLQIGTSGERVSLVPGEQSILSGTTITKRAVDTAPYIAWKDGNFHFDNISLSDMLKQMSRWYDVDVVYENVVPKERFSGAMSRSVTLQTVLELLRISEINYRIVGNKLIIE